MASVTSMFKRTAKPPTPTTQLLPAGPVTLDESYELCREFNKRHGTKVTVVHYMGEGPMWPDVGSGVTQGGVGSYVAVAPHLARGTIKVLATVGNERCPKLPDVK